MCYLVLEPFWWLAVTVKTSLRRWGELCAISLGAVNQIFSLPKGSEGEGSESTLLCFRFPNPSSLPNRISLQEDWDMNWRSIQICYCLRTWGQNPKRAAIPKVRNTAVWSENTAGPWLAADTAVELLSLSKPAQRCMGSSLPALGSAVLMTTVCALREIMMMLNSPGTD